MFCCSTAIHVPFLPRSILAKAPFLMIPMFEASETSMFVHNPHEIRLVFPLSANNHSSTQNTLPPRPFWQRLWLHHRWWWRTCLLRFFNWGWVIHHSHSRSIQKLENIKTWRGVSHRTTILEIHVYLLGGPCIYPCCFKYFNRLNSFDNCVILVAEISI